MYTEAASCLQKIYHFPIKFIEYLLKNFIKYNEPKYRTASIRVIGNKTRKESVTLKIQVVNSRAKYYIPLYHVINDNHFLLRCEPLSLIEMGRLSKKEELIKVGLLQKGQQPKGIKYTKRHPIKTEIISIEKYPYAFIELTSLNESLAAKIFIRGSNKFFDTPVDDLLNDMSLLENIYPPDLLALGYRLYERSDEETHNYNSHY